MAHSVELRVPFYIKHIISVMVVCGHAARHTHRVDPAGGGGHNGRMCVCTEHGARLSRASIVVVLPVGALLQPELSQSAHLECGIPAPGYTDRQARNTYTQTRARAHTISKRILPSFAHRANDGRFLHRRPVDRPQPHRRRISRTHSHTLAYAFYFHLIFQLSRSRSHSHTRCPSTTYIACAEWNPFGMRRSGESANKHFVACTHTHTHVRRPHILPDDALKPVLFVHESRGTQIQMLHTHTHTLVRACHQTILIAMRQDGVG